MNERKIRKAQGARLAAARLAASYRSARAAALENGWPESTYRAHESGGRTIGQDDADRYAKAFRAMGAEVSAQQILFGETGSEARPITESDRRVRKDSPRGDGVPEYDLRAGMSYGGGYVMKDINGGEEVKDRWFFPDSWLRGEMRLSLANTNIIAVDGPSMLPDLSPGDRVLIDLSNRDPKQDAIFAIRDGDSVIIKHVQLIRDADPPRIICTSSNERYKPFELILDGQHVAIIGRVAGKISKM